MIGLPKKESSVYLAAFLFVITLSGLQLSAEKLRESPRLIVLGGFISSLLFFFAVVFLGSIKKEIKWLDAGLCLLVACACAIPVHRICVTTCMLFSAAMLFYLNFMSSRIMAKVSAYNTGKRVESKSPRGRSVKQD
eukprot:TRINITY_DN45_c0_g1_i2.p1 TRINITY_DN45_c0_g1~~TRINITY_DN45_c0_g1_i2.p1  ORF type:complete len:136 (-),score=12.41 TRINITY_DN45_c0_g1_i2:56-463(-)